MFKSTNEYGVSWNVSTNMKVGALISYEELIIPEISAAAGAGTGAGTVWFSTGYGSPGTGQQTVVEV